MRILLLLVCYGNTLLPQTHSFVPHARPTVTTRKNKSLALWTERARTPLFLSSQQQTDTSARLRGAAGSLPSLDAGLEKIDDSRATKDLQIHRYHLSESLVKINKLQASLSQASDEEALNSLEDALNGVEKEVSVWTRALVPPVGLALEDYAKAIEMYVRLPFRMRVAICSALEMEDSVKAASDWDRVPEIVTLMYYNDVKTQEAGESSLLTPQRIQNAMKEVEVTLANARTMSEQPASSSSSSSTTRAMPTTSTTGTTSIFSNDLEEDGLAREATVQQLYGRVTRKENRVATENDLKTLMSALNNDMFLPSGKPEKIEGGYIIRGKNQKKSGADLIQSLDDKLPADWSAQVCYVQDDFQTAEEGARAVLGDDADKVLLLLNKDMSATTNPWILFSTSAVAICIAYLFSVGVYGGNDAVETKISEQALFGDYSASFGWLNGKVLEVFLSLGAIQLIHDLGQRIVAKKEGIKTSLPTVLPGLGLPFLNTMVKIEESPKNFRALFSYAIIGPLLGLVASLIFLIVGLQLTSSADPATAQLLPSLPVNVLRISTLGATIIDYIYGGGPGFVSLQDPQSFVQLHPLAIAGFTGLVMNALEVLPIGGTDGGRMSLAVFGRSGHSIVGGFAWLILLVAALFLERGEALVGAWAVYNIAQSDPEIPCRDEVEQVDLTRAAAAGALWFLAILAITPL